MDLKRTLAVAIDPTGARAGGAQAEAAFRGVGNAARGAEGSTKSFTSSLLSLRNIVAVLGLGSLVRELYQTDVAMFKLQNQLKASSGGAEEFRRNFDYLRGTAQKLGLDLTSAGTGFGKFVASARGKLTGSQIREAFTAITEASTAMGLSADETNGTIVALSQMLSKGTVSAEELRQQLGERLPGAFAMAAQAIGRTEKELNKMLDSGTLMADELIPKLAKVMTARFGAQALEGAKSLSAEMNRLKTAWLEVQMVFMSEGGESIFSRVIRGAKDAMTDFRDWLAGMFEAGREGKLSEFVAASLRVGFGKAANYFGGFVKTATEMLAEAGKAMFTEKYMTNLIGAFQAVAAAFGLALLKALRQPLSALSAAVGVLSGETEFGQQKRDIRGQVEKDIIGQNMTSAQARLLAEGPTLGMRMFASPDYKEAHAKFQKLQPLIEAEQTRRLSGLPANDRKLSFDELFNRKMSGEQEFFGVKITELEKINEEALKYSIGELAKGTAGAASGALGKLKDFKPLNSVDTSADESILSGFSARSGNQWKTNNAADLKAENNPIKDKTYWSEIKRGIEEATGSLTNLYDQSFKVGGQAVGAMTRGFTDFFSGIIDGTESVASAFKKMAASILSDIAKIIATRMVAEPLAGAIMGGISGLSGGWSGFNSIDFSGATSVAGISHTGGIIGSTVLSQKLVNPSVFNHAPRLHSGLKPDEFPAILQRGEEVIPKGGRGGGVSMSMPITVNVDGGKGGTPEQNQKMGAEIARQIQGMVDERIARAVMPRGILSAVRA